MENKKCFKCNNIKDLSLFYRHPKMADGYLGKCKSCTKIDAKNDYYVKSTDVSWLLKERERAKEKYIRLNYKEECIKWRLKYPWHNRAKYKNLSRKFKIPKGIQLHHWNYGDNFLEDVILLKTKDHYIAHTFLKLDLQKKIFIDNKGNYLDTKEKHLLYLISKGINF